MNKLQLILTQGGLSRKFIIIMVIIIFYKYQ